ncbi:hypothetical protein ABD90_03525 [Lysinibacillus fusiformis]|uniref:Uncharacterized protein n=1 Tax=Lysinibacillus sphaericus CBAM5 TaxID=1400869 RepID=W7S3H2_LYSSH|nr:hypothetical protein AR327_16545 [Lysinibacillus sphaericus]EWH34205.1 hypothetical protein P799_07595 [Lysinibacillus sphaericus CBAM5]MBG9724377.1 hypothetical protein [Lysinibacillus fusiformis]AMR90969.1 hypothetical protein A1T07_12665 [Lysinibacillus sphaericus]ANA45019.1 hypothetical protein A2J09_05335 [Lysinibacillus sphaericus]
MKKPPQSNPKNHKSFYQLTLSYLMNEYKACEINRNDSLFRKYYRKLAKIRRKMLKYSHKGGGKVWGN